MIISLFHKQNEWDRTVSKETEVLHQQDSSKQKLGVINSYSMAIPISNTNSGGTKNIL